MQFTLWFMTTIEILLVLYYSTCSVLGDFSSEKDETFGETLKIFGKGSNPPPQKLYVNYTGDLIIGALFPIHRRGSGNDICDKIQPEDGLQPLEVLLHTIDKINNNGTILPGIKLGILALDTCDSNIYALEQSLDFIKGYLAHYNEHHEQEFVCNDSTTPVFRGRGYDKLVGVIGGQSSSVSIKVANLLRLFHIPQVSYMSTSPLLSDRERFPYFFRTVPSDINQVHAILDILRKFNWTYTSVVYSDSEYGIHCYEKLRDFADSEICFSNPAQRIIRDQFVASDYELVMQNIINRPEVRVIILILEKEYTMFLLEAARKLNVGTHYVFLGTDGWSNRESVVMGRHDILEGSIAVQPLISHVQGFDNYFMNLTTKHVEKNPWFKEFLEDHFQCKFPETPLTKFNKDFNKTCSENVLISKENGYSQQSFLHFVRDSAYTFAYALRSMQKSLCGEHFVGICENMKHIDGVDVVRYLRNVTFKDEEENIFKFVKDGDGPIRYTIINFQHTLKGGPKWITVGNYSRSKNGIDDKLELLIEGEFKYRKKDNFTYPQSTCTIPCQAHQIKVRERDDTCCWKCRDCGSRYHVKIDEFNCMECGIGSIPNSNHSQCISTPVIYIDYTNPWAIGGIFFAGLGMLTTIFVAVVFWNYNDTPIIKAAGRELSYALLLGIFLSFTVTFVIVSEPNRISCGFVRFLLGFCPTLCYAAITTKLNRISRIFHNSAATPKTKYTSPKSQMIIVSLLTSIDVIINAIWIVADPPGPLLIHPERSFTLKICGGLHNYSYMIGFIYPLILITFCTIYAIQTRKCPEGFNETKYIAFTNYTIIIIWLAFVLSDYSLYLANTSNAIRVVTLAISLSLSGFVELFCLFFPKVYIVICKPQNNTKEQIMQPNRNSFLSASACPCSYPHPHQIQLHSNHNHATIQSTGGIPETNNKKRKSMKKASLTVDAEFSSYSDGIYFKNLSGCASEPNIENMDNSEKD